MARLEAARQARWPRRQTSPGALRGANHVPGESQGLPLRGLPDESQSGIQPNESCQPHLALAHRLVSGLEGLSGAPPGDQGIGGAFDPSREAARLP
jgi:hypothetical protein